MNSQKLCRLFDLRCNFTGKHLLAHSYVSIISNLKLWFIVFYHFGWCFRMQKNLENNKKIPYDINQKLVSDWIFINILSNKYSVQKMTLFCFLYCGFKLLCSFTNDKNHRPLHSRECSGSHSVPWLEFMQRHGIWYHIDEQKNLILESKID